MALQTTVNRLYAIGVPGEPATPVASEYYPLQPIAATNGVVVGSFVWLNSDGEITNTKPTSGKPVGIVEREVMYPIRDTTLASLTSIPAGSAATVAVKGDYYVKAGAAATVGQKVFAGANGVCLFGVAGASVSGAVETDWYVVTAGSTDDIIVIANH